MYIPSRRHLLSMVAVAGLSVVSLGTANAEDGADAVGAGTTVPPTTVAAAPTTTVAGAPTTVAGAPTTVAAGAAVLAPASTTEQISAAVAAVVGPTPDFAAKIAPFGIIFPTGVTTPEGSAIDNFDIYYYPDVEDPTRSYFDTTIVFTTAVPAADLVTLYQTDMLAAGFTQTGDSVENNDGEQVRFLEYSNPNSTFDRATVTIGIVDGDTDYAQVQVTDALDPAVAQIFSAWPVGLPLVDQATEIQDVSVNLSGFGGDFYYNLSTVWNLPIPSADARAQMEAGLAGTPYAIDPDQEATDTSLYLTAEGYDGLTVFIDEGFPEGTSYFSVRGTVDLQL